MFGLNYGDLRNLGFPKRKLTISQSFENSLDSHMDSFVFQYVKENNSEGGNLGLS